MARVTQWTPLTKHTMSSPPRDVRVVTQTEQTCPQEGRRSRNLKRQPYSIQHTLFKYYSCSCTYIVSVIITHQSKQQARAINASVVHISAIASAVTSANPAKAVHTSCAPLSSAAAPAHRNRVQTPQRRTKTSRGRANSSRVRQMPRSCLFRQLPAPSHLRIQRKLCTHHASR